MVHWHADVRGGQGLLLRTGYPFYALFERRLLRRARRIIATSEAYLRSSPTLRPHRDRCVVVPLGLDPQRLVVRPAAGPDAQGRERTVLAAGRLARYKGFEYLIRAAALLPELNVEIVGSGPCRARLEAEIRRHGLEGRVRLSGYLPDAELQARMARAGVFCLPSIHRSEAFGVVLLEAMSLGTPLVSTAIPGSGTGWVNRDGETGRVVPPADAQALAQALRELLEDPARRSRMGAAGQRRFEECFHIARIAAAVDGVYRAALRG